MEHYQKSKEAAYRTLLDGGVSAFPFDIVRLATHNNISIIKNRDTNELRDGEAAVIIFDGSDWYVVYDETIPSRDYKRYVLAHELGRKALRHDLMTGLTTLEPNSLLRVSQKRKYAKMNVPQEEIEAEAFARHLLAPLFLLREINITDSRDIARVCQIPIELAELQAEILEYYMTATTPLNQLEKQLYEQCRGFIEKYKK